MSPLSRSHSRHRSGAYGRTTSPNTALARSSRPRLLYANPMQPLMGPDGWRNANLRTQLWKLIKRAGLMPWPRLFHNRRASRETELVAQFPIQVVTAWLGNTPTIAMQHYLQVRDSDYEAAIKDIGTSVVIPPPVSTPALYGRDADGPQKSPDGLLSCIASAIALHLAPPNAARSCFSEGFAGVSIPAASTESHGRGIARGFHRSGVIGPKPLLQEGLAV